MYCYLLVYYRSRSNAQEIVQVALSFNLIKAQQDYHYHGDVHCTLYIVVFFIDDEAVTYVRMYNVVYGKENA